MREIKFRCFIKSKNKILPVISIVNMNDEQGIRVFPDKPIIEGEQINYLTSDGDIEIMQFTGLLDKNGKEIYEGDIYEFNGSIKTNIGNGEEIIGTYFICEIVFVHGGFCGKIIKAEWIKKCELYKESEKDWIKNKIGQTLGFGIYSIDNFVFRDKIIGNIYENSGLIK